MVFVTQNTCLFNSCSLSFFIFSCFFLLITVKRLTTIIPDGKMHAFLELILNYINFNYNYLFWKD